MNDFWHPLLLSTMLASLTVVIVLPVLVVAADLIHRCGKWGLPLRALLTLPMVLPPTVLGFYLLLTFSPQGWLGRFASNWDLRLVFSIPGMLAACCIVVLPYMLHPLLSGLQGIPTGWTEIAHTMGKGHWNILWHIKVPTILPSLLTAAVLGFARIMGEFGVVLMVGGKIPGKTLVASMAVYDAVETMDYSLAMRYSLILSILSFGLLALFLQLGGKRQVYA